MNYPELREKILVILKKRELAVMMAAKEIGISHLTLGNIVHDRRNISLATRFKIENWLEKMAIKQSHECNCKSCDYNNERIWEAADINKSANMLMDAYKGVFEKLSKD